MLLACTQTSSASAFDREALPSPAESASEFAPGEAIVRFEPGTTVVERRAARHRAGVGFDSSLALPRVEVVEVDGPVAAAVRRLERQLGVAYAQPNYRYEALAVEPPDDTFFEQLWGLSDPALPDPGVGALEAWEESKGSGQVIAVADTGVDLTHPDLAGNLWTNPLEAPGLPGDQDSNGFVDDVHGYDFVDDDGDPDDYEFHGTHVAGTAAAIAANDEGIAGVAPAAEIMAVRVLDGDGSGSTDDIADGVAYAAENGADVVNFSLGGPAGKEDPVMEDAIELAGAEDTVVVAAAGNAGVDNDVEPHTPCALPQANLICVAAVTQGGGLASFSNYGLSSVDIAAPGSNILSAKVDYDEPLFSNGFETGETALWATDAFNGGILWGLSSKASTGAQSATDSPAGNYGQADDPEEWAVSELFTGDPVNLSGQRGCRVHFRGMYETEEFFDYFAAGAADEGTEGDFAFFTGASSGYPTVFSREEASISDLDGQNDVHPLFAMLSDASEERDGAYVDDVRLICRDSTYVNEEVSVSQYDLPNVGNYVRFNGTSMAAPHVSGVAALVQDAAPGLSAVQVVDAILTGASAIPAPDSSRRTATEGIADACQAIAVATESPDPIAACSGSSESTIPPPPPPPGPDPGSTTTTTTTTTTPPPPGDTTRPRTFFRQRPPRVVRTRTSRARAVFRFGADEANVSFICRIDGAPWRRCRPRLVRRFSVGRHVVRVVARDAAGNVDASPAVARFRVKRRG